MLEHIVFAIAFFHLFGPTFPQKSHGIGKRQCAVAYAVTAFVPRFSHFVARKFQRRVHELVIFPPTAEKCIPGIAFAVLHKDAYGFGFGFAHQSGIVVAATHCHKCAHGGVDAAEEVGPIPRSRPSAYSAAAGSRYGAVVGIAGDVHHSAVGECHAFHLGQQFLLQKFSPFTVHCVEFSAAIVAHHIATAVAHHARLHKHTYAHRHITRGYERVHFGCSIVEYAVHAHQQTSRLVAAILRRHIHLICSLRAGIDDTMVVSAAHYCARRHRLRLHRQPHQAGHDCYCYSCHGK